MKNIYIADGHHRSASSVLLCKNLREKYPDFREPLQLEIGNIVKDKYNLTSKIDKEWSLHKGGKLELKSLYQGVGGFIKRYGGAPGRWIGK